MGVPVPRVRILAGFDDPVCRPERWNRLLPRGTDVVYLTWEYQRAWWEAFGYGRLLLVGVESTDGIDLVAPFYAKDGMLELLCSGAADYLDFVGRADAAVLARLFSAAAERVDGFSGVRLYCLPSWSPTPALVRAAAARLGWACYEEQRWPAPVIDLSRADAVRSGAGSGRRERYLRRRGRLELRRFDSPDLIRLQLDAFFTQHVARFELGGGRSFFTDPVRRRFFERLTARVAPRGWMRLNRLDWNGRSIAYEVGWPYGRAYFGGPICFAPDLARRSPGKVLFHRLVLGALEDGLRCYDLGTGDDRYKLTFATHVRETCTLGLYPFA